jgi:hypothetical protein
MAVRWSYTLALIGAVALLGGCSESFSQLPAFAKLPEKVLSKDEQQGKVNQMIEKRQSHEAEAAKAIERGR